MGDTGAVRITRKHGITGAATATGATVVIDVFRAYSAAAYAFAAGATRILLATEVHEALTLARQTPDAVIMGEVDGIKPEGFHLGNSPGEIISNQRLVAGRTIVHRSSAGTRSARAALDNGANPVFVSSLVVASATAAAVRQAADLTIVSSGLSGTGVAEEDDICGDAITLLLCGDPPDMVEVGNSVANLARARTLLAAGFAHPDDVALCTAADRFGFAMEAAVEDDAVVVIPISDPGS